MSAPSFGTNQIVFVSLVYSNMPFDFCDRFKQNSVSSMSSSIDLKSLTIILAYWHYSPLWILTFSVIFFHSALSSHCFLRRLNTTICISYSVPEIHLFRGLTLVLVPIGFHCNILLGVLLSSIYIT